MKVLLLNQVFYPDVAATAQHGTDLANHLVKEGHEVIAIASRSMYGHKGAVLPRYEVYNGIEIHRVGSSYFGKSGTIGRILDFGLWYILAFFKIITVKRCDVCVAFTTPPFIAMLGLILRLLRGTKLVYWTMDLYPDVPVLYGMLKENGILTRLLEKLHRFILRKADHIIVLGRCMLDRILEKGIARDKISVVRVWADASEIIPASHVNNVYRNEWDIDSAKTIVMYSGNFGLMHDADTILGAIAALRDYKDIVFIFVGGGNRTDEARFYVNKHTLNNVRFEPYQPRERINDLLTLADIHLISLINGAEGLIVPCKLFGILAAGRPAVYIGSAKSEIGRIIQEENCGYIFEQGNIASLTACIMELAQKKTMSDTMGNNGREALVTKYDRSLSCAAIELCLKHVLGITQALPVVSDVSAHAARF